MSKLQTGKILYTPSVTRLTEEYKAFSDFLKLSLERHKNIDTDLCHEEQVQNVEAVNTGAEVISSYKIPSDLLELAEDDQVWIVTQEEDCNGNRVSTKILWPYEY